MINWNKISESISAKQF